MQDNTIRVSIQRVGHDGVIPPLPHRATEGAAGADLTACIREPVTVAPRQLVRIPTGIAVAVPAGYAALLYARSGLATKFGVTLSNCVGVVDSDYRGEIQVGLCNVSDAPYTIEPGERIAQMVIAPVAAPAFVEEALDETARGAGGFGSTGKY